MLIFFTRPFRVAMKRYLSSGKSLTCVTAVIFSSFSALMRFITGFPFAERCASGMVWTFLICALPGGREQDNIRVGRGDVELVDEIVIPHDNADLALAAAQLLLVQVEGGPLYIAAVSDRDDDFFFLYHVLDRDLGQLVHYLRQPAVAVLVPDFDKFLL